MKVLITGSSGQLGSATVKHLQTHHHKVYGIDIIPSPTTHQLIDLNDRHKVMDVCRDYDAIIHTAAIHGKHYELNYPRKQFIDTNIGGTLNLLDACINNSIPRFLYTSTTSIYGDAMIDYEKAVWVDEALTERPRDIYDITKQTAEQLCRDYFRREGLQASVYRVARFLPESDELKTNHRLYRGLDERDGAEALRLALGVHFKSFEIFNISSGSPFNKDDLYIIKHNPAQAVLKYYPDAAEIYKARGWQLPASIDRVYICEKAAQYLGYQPLYTFAHLLYNNKG